MRIKIISEGTGMTTMVVDADTGEKLKGVRAVTWSCESRGLATATFEIVNVPAELTVEGVDYEEPIK